MDSPSPLTGKHALVTGGSRGIGAAIAAALLDRGARVTLLARDPEALEALSDSLNDKGRVEWVCADVRYRDAVERALGEAAAKGGGIDILVNNAGQAASAPLHKTDDQLWNAMLEVNLTGTFYCIRAAVPYMLQSGWGRIVNIASTAGLKGYGYVSAYCAAKHGVIGLTRSLAIELAERGVTVNAVCPGFTDTDLVRDAVAHIASRTGRTEEQARAELAAMNPQKRLVQPDEVAATVAWLCLPQNAAITGVALPVAGGEVG